MWRRAMGGGGGDGEGGGGRGAVCVCGVVRVCDVVAVRNSQWSNPYQVIWTRLIRVRPSGANSE